MAVQKVESKIIEINELTPTVKSYKLSVPDEFEFKPGQYVSLSLVLDGRMIRRPYSIASNPEKKGFIELCIKKVDNGPVSEYMHNIKDGEDIKFYGPLGKFVIEESSRNKDIIFISSGTGITPFISMINHLLINGFKNKITLIQGTRSEDEMLYEQELSGLKENHPNFNFNIVLSRPKKEDYENRGYVQDFIEMYVPENFKGDFYLCGLSDMIKSVSKKLTEKKISENRIFFEKYD